MMSELWFSPVFWVLALTGVFLTGISKSGFAGGAGVVAVPLLALVVSPSIALVLTLPLLLLMDAQTIAFHRRNLAMAELKIIVPAALLGVLLASALLGVLSEAALQLLLGCLSLLFAAHHMYKPRLILRPGAAWGLAGLAGVTSTLIHAGGPPLNMYLATRALPRAQWISTAAIFFVAINFAKLFAYAGVGLWRLEGLLLSLCLVPAAVAGVMLGHRIQARISEAAFLRFIMAFLAVSGLLLIARSVVAFTSA